MRKKQIFLTGAAGSLGSSIRSLLRARYDFRLLLHATVPDDVHPDDQVVVGSVADDTAMVEAASGVDAIVHLAIRRWRGITAEDVAKATLEVDNPGVYNILEAARINEVPVVVFASTNHVTGLYEKDGLVSTPESPVRPDGVYGAGKAFGEALGRFYAERYGMRVICLRVANFNGRDAPGQQYQPGYSRWLSPRDLAQLVWRSIEAEHVAFGIFYGVSGGCEKKWDLSNARELLGYVPEDDGSLPKQDSKA